MREKAKELFNLPITDGELDVLGSLTDAKGANVTVEQRILLSQMQAAMKGSTEAAMFLQNVIGEESDISDDTAISEAAKAGDTLAMLKALRDKLSALADKSTNVREVASITRQLIDVNDRLDDIEKNQKNKQGENPLNIIMFSSAQKRARKAARA